MDSLVKAVKLDGFTLEEKILDIFEAHGFIAKSNAPLPDGSPVDVLARDSNSIFAIECKGYAPTQPYFMG